MVRVFSLVSIPCMSRIVHFCYTDETNKIVQQFVCSLLEEFETASSDTAWTRGLLFPHLQHFQVNVLLEEYEGYIII